jgi:hypothetical protein
MPVGGEDQKRRVRVGDEERGDDVVLLQRAARQALAAAFLGAEIDQRRALDVAALRDRDDHVLALDQVLVLHVAGPVDDLGPAGDGEFLAHLGEFVGDDRMIRSREARMSR